MSRGICLDPLKSTEKEQPCCVWAPGLEQKSPQTCVRALSHNSPTIAASTAGCVSASSVASSCTFVTILVAVARTPLPPSAFFSAPFLQPRIASRCESYTNTIRTRQSQHPVCAIYIFQRRASHMPLAVAPLPECILAHLTAQVLSAKALAAASESVIRILSKTMPPDVVRSSKPTALIGCMLWGCSSTK